MTYHYHEFNQHESTKVNRDFGIQAHPEIFILNKQGRLVRKFVGVVEMDELVDTLRPLIQ